MITAFVTGMLVGGMLGMLLMALLTVPPDRRDGQ